MKYLWLVLLLGCVTTEQDGAGPEESESVAALTAMSCVSGPNTGSWCTESVPTSAQSKTLNAIWAASATDVFAVGDSGTILRRVNGTWTAMTSGTTVDLRGVYGTSSSDVWAGGLGGALVHFDGTAWSTVSGPTSDINAVYASSPTDAWFAGSTVVQHWTGSQFISSNFQGPLLAISGTSSSDVYVSGETATVRHWNGSAWANLTPGAASTYFAVLAIGVNDAWVSDAASSKQTAHWNGSAWSFVSTGTAVFVSMSALSTSDIWGVAGTKVGHKTGSSWTVDSGLFPGSQMRAVTTRPGHAWISGAPGFIAHHAF